MTEVTREILAEFDDVFFEPDGVDNSVYAAQTSERFDIGQAIGTLASAFNADAFAKKKQEEFVNKIENAIKKTPSERKNIKDVFAVKSASIAIPCDLLHKSEYKKTPAGNMHFTPACDYHYDICFKNKNAFLEQLLNRIISGQITTSFMREADFSKRAAIVMSHLILRHGVNLDRIATNGEWENLGTSAEDQLRLLKTIAGEFGMESHPELA